MNKKREMKWYEDAFLGVLFIFLGCMVLFNGFSFLVDFLFTEEELTSPTKQKGLLLITAWIETTNWKFFIIFFFGLSATLAFGTAFKKYKSKNPDI